MIFARAYLATLLGSAVVFSFAEGPKDVDLTIGVTSLGAKESRTSGYLGLSKVMPNGTTAQLHATLGSKKTFAGNGFNIRYGGSDIELRLGRNVSDTTKIFGGLAVADTPSGKSRPYLSFGASTELYKNTGMSLTAVGRMVTRTESQLYGVGARIDVPMKQVHLYAEGLHVSGSANTYSITNGSSQQRPVYRLGLSSNWRGHDFEVGFTNQTGRTTGGSLTPGLGKGVGFYGEFKVRF